MSAIDLNLHRQLGGLLERETGQLLPVNRHWRIEIALKPVLRKHSIPDFAMLAILLADDAARGLAQECIEAMINNETSFFRDQANFALMTGPVLDALRARNEVQKKLRIWCSACSTGQEAYSLAIHFAENPEKWRGWTVQILGTDISASAIAQARSGCYSQLEIQRGLPVKLMLKYFGQRDTDWILNDDVRRRAIFTTHNLLASPISLGRFDLILCRNLLMYLGEAARTMAFDNLAVASAASAILMLGAAETPVGQTDKFHASADFRGFYERAAA